MSEPVGEIRSGHFGAGGAMVDYKAEHIADIMIERVVWAEREPLTRYGVVIAATSFVWFRFWLPRLAQVVERYYTAGGDLVGTLIDLCTPPQVAGTGYCATDLKLDLWLSADGRLTLHNEPAFEQAIHEGALGEEQVVYAEEHLRALTAAIALNRFPPAIVRNWQIDVDKIHVEL